MQIKRWHIQMGSLPLLTIFLAGLIAGIFIMNLGKSVLLDNTGLLDEYALYQMKYMTVDSSALFCYVLRKRIGSVLVLAVMATTYLGMVVCVGITFWYGISAGAFVAALIIRYGLKGVLLILAGIFPHYLLYAPAMAALLVWCEKLYHSIYLQNYTELEAENKFFLPKRLLKLLALVCMIALGCLLESFYNPRIMLALLKIF